MGAPKGNKFAEGAKGGVGGPEKYKPQYATQVKKACEAGFTDFEVAELFGVSERTINRWKLEHKDFASAQKAAKEPADERVERSLFHKAVGYTFDAVKVMQYEGEPIYAPYKEHVPPSDTAAIFWLKNRRPDVWRDRTQHELTGKDGETLTPILNLTVTPKPD